MLFSRREVLPVSHRIPQQPLTYWPILILAGRRWVTSCCRLSPTPVKATN